MCDDRRDPTCGGAGAVSRGVETGLPVVHLGTVITREDVHALEDEN
ncbi:hypothetical protein ACIBFB_07435 [Nocardiopsis sp. NPDC050513]